MKKIIMGVVICALLSLSLGQSVLGQTSASGPSGTASATVPSYLEFTLKKVVRMDPAAGDVDPWNDGTDLSTAPNFNFGTLLKQTDADGKLLYMKGTYYYYVLMIAATSGRRYKITETGQQLTSGSNTIPKESVLLFPDYSWADTLGGVAQGAPPGTAYLGPVTSACNTDSLVYQSDNGGLSRIVRAVVAIAGPPAGANWPYNYSLGYTDLGVGQGTKNEYTSWKAITQDQRSGTYQGQITFTLTLN